MVGITIEKLRAIFAAKKYNFYDDKAFRLNIIGVRNTNSQSNSFDDTLIIAWYETVSLNAGPNWIIKTYAMTTDPGKPWLLKPMDPAGCAVMIPGQYVNAYMIGIHGRSRAGNRQYEALEQIGSIAYVRDNNKDAVIDFSLYQDPVKREKNQFWAILKTNIHRASQWSIVRAVETYSAGCQVIENPADFNELMVIARKCRDRYGLNKFTYTLLEESDFL